MNNVEVKQIDLPQEMQRAMAKQAEAERERRAKVIHADGELQAATKLKEAADHMSQNPVTVQLRYLQTLSEIATENNSTTLFPVPIDLFNRFTKTPDSSEETKHGAPRSRRNDSTKQAASRPFFGVAGVAVCAAENRWPERKKPVQGALVQRRARVRREASIPRQERHERFCAEGWAGLAPHGGSRGSR